MISMITLIPFTFNLSPIISSEKTLNNEGQHAFGKRRTASFEGLWYWLQTITNIHIFLSHAIETELCAMYIIFARKGILFIHVQHVTLLKKKGNVKKNNQYTFSNLHEKRNNKRGSSIWSFTCYIKLHTHVFTCFDLRKSFLLMRDVGNVR